MLKKNLTKSDYFIIAANLLPVAGVLLWDWSPVEVFIVYCLETIIIGILTLLKMGIVITVRKDDTWYNGDRSSKKPGLFFMLFFLVHYGMFVAIQMGIFFAVSGISAKAHINFFDFIFKWPSLLNSNSLILLAAFFFCYGLKMIFDFLITRQYKTVSLMKLMFEPYGRIFIQQFTVILGSTFLSFGAGKIFIVIFAFIKIFFEVFIDYNAILNKGIKDMENKSAQK